MPGALSIDIRKRIVQVYYHNKRTKLCKQERNVQSVSRRLLVSQAIVRKYVNIFKRTASCKSHNEIHNVRHGRNAKYDSVDLVVLRYVIRRNPTLYLDEIRMELIERRRKHFSTSGAFRMLNECNITRKRLGKKVFHWQYRSVQIYFNHLRSLHITKSQLLFADKSYYNDRIANRTYGRSVKYVFAEIPLYTISFLRCNNISTS